MGHVTKFQEGQMDKKRLADAVRQINSDCKDVLYDADIDNQEVTDAMFLLKVLAHIIEGMPIEKAFGSPGDWGHSTPIGKALCCR